MIRVLGAACIIAAGMLAGWHGKRELVNRVRSLTDGEIIAEHMRMVVCVRRQPLPCVLAELQTAMPGRFREAAAAYNELQDVSFGEYWHACLLAAGLHPETVSVLDETVESISGGQQTERAMDICSARLGRCRELADGQLREKGRLYMAFGSAGGGLLALLLL